MSPQQAAAQPAASPTTNSRRQTSSAARITARLAPLALYLLVGLVALLPRVLDLGGFLDSDENNFWLGRSEEWLNALQAGDFAATAISTHPGVTTMWLGSAGIVLRRTLLEWGWLHEMPFPTLLTLMRMPVVLAHVVGVLVGYALLRRLLPLALATLAALLWAADPFVIAYQRILHVDGLTTTFATLSLLAACLYWHHTRHSAALLLSAVCGALAVLSKSPGLAVLPVVAGMALAAFVWPPPPLQRRSLWVAAGSLVLWGALFALTIVLVWPAVWAAPLDVYNLLRVGVEVEGGSPHVVGNFFLGEANSTPGPAYYPVALALRTTPITLLGLFVLPLVWRRAPELAATRRDLAALALLVILFVVGLSLFPKKLNRYLVPVFPALDILAAVGLAWGVERLRGLLCGLRAARWCAPAAAQVALVGVVGSAAVLNAAHWHPYGMVAFNQVLGGAPAGARTFLLGDGEGLGQVADWLHQQPDITGVTVASTMINSLQPYLRQGVQSVSPDRQLSERVGYVVVYIRHTQRGPLRTPFNQFYPQATPAHTVRLHGIEYAWIYEVPRPIAHRLTASFGPGLQLRGYEIDTAAHTEGSVLLKTQWRTEKPIGQDYTMFVHLLDAQGQRISQIDVPPGGPGAPTSAWSAGRVIYWEHPVPVPADLPPGDYWLALGLYHPETFARLTLDPAPPHPAGAPAVDDAMLLPLSLDGEPGSSEQ